MRWLALGLKTLSGESAAGGQMTFLGPDEATNVDLAESRQKRDQGRVACFLHLRDLVYLWGATFGSCADCWRDPNNYWSWGQWRRAEPCCNCGRPVINTLMQRRMPVRHRPGARPLSPPAG
jgi:hypothetical protein